MGEFCLWRNSIGESLLPTVLPPGVRRVKLSSEQKTTMKAALKDREFKREKKEKKS